MDGYIFHFLSNHWPDGDGVGGENVLFNSNDKKFFPFIANTLTKLDESPASLIKNINVEVTSNPSDRSIAKEAIDSSYRDSGKAFIWHSPSTWKNLLRSSRAVSE